MPDTNTNILGETNQIINFETRLENRELAISMAGQARRTLKILTYDLENAVYDCEPFIQAVTQLVKRSQNVKVHILIRDSTSAIKQGHRLIELARKFSSYIHLHNLSRDDEGYMSAFLVADKVVTYINKIQPGTKGLPISKMPSEQES